MLQRRNVTLQQPEHIYTDEFRNRYVSVTTSLGMVSPKFNDAYWLLYKALQRSGYKVRPDVGRWEYITVDGIEISLLSLQSGLMPLSVQTSHIKGEWNSITKIACDKGSKVHGQIEDGTNATNNIMKGEKSGKNVLDFLTLKKQYPEVYRKIKEDLDDEWKVFTEKIVYLNDPLLAGMIDLLITKGKRFRIKDWKTNKNPLMYKSGYYKKDANGIVTDRWIDTNEKMLAPIAHLDNSNGNKYSLQLSIYAYILECWGMILEPNGLELCHIRGDFDDNGVFIPVEEPKWYPIRYMKDEAAAIVRYVGMNQQKRA